MKYKNANVFWFDNTNCVVVQGSTKELLDFLEEFFTGDMEEIYEEVPKQEIIDEYDQDDFGELLEDFYISLLPHNLMVCENAADNLNLEKMKEVGITYSDINKFLKEFVVVSFEDEEECKLCKKAIEENDLTILTELQGSYCYIFPEDFVFEDGTMFADLLYTLKVTPMPDAEDFFCLEGTQQELDFLKKVCKIYCGTEEFYGI